MERAGLKLGHLYSSYELSTSPVVRAPAPRPTAPAANAVLTPLWDRSRLIVLKQFHTELLLELEKLFEKGSGWYPTDPNRCISYSLELEGPLLLQPP